MVGRGEVTAIKGHAMVALVLCGSSSKDMNKQSPNMLTCAQTRCMKTRCIVKGKAQKALQITRLLSFSCCLCSITRRQGKGSFENVFWVRENLRPFFAFLRFFDFFVVCLFRFSSFFVFLRLSVILLEDKGNDCNFLQKWGIHSDPVCTDD